MPFPDLPPALGQALAARGYDEPTGVQSAVLAPETAGRDLLVSAQTGSGKTVAFGLALADTLLEGAERLPPPAAPLVLVIAPTRELALQVKTELTWLYAKAGARIAASVGGTGVRGEQQALMAGCHIVVGTPGRLRDHLEHAALDLSQLRAVVLDEADEMLDMGFRDELEAILDAAPPSPQRRTLLFSATIAREIAALAARYQSNALRIDTVNRNQPHADIDYRAVLVAPHDIERAAVNVLRYFESRSTLVFCATREGTKRLHARLCSRGFDAVILSGELSQAERNNALHSLRDGRASVCVATDVAARGLDLPELDLVIHADLPTNKETLLHRSGRTGRAGRKGVSVLMVPFAKRRRAEQLLQAARLDAGWSDPPGADLIEERDQERLLADPALTTEAATEDTALGALLLEKFGAETVASALARMVRARLPKPERDFDQPPASAPAHARAVRSPHSPDRPHATPHQAPAGPTNWFRISVGRRNNADPKWLIPLICRLGGVTKADIGSIRIFDTDTRFEISSDAAPAFAAETAVLDPHEPRIEAATPAGGTRPSKPYRGDKAKGPRKPRAHG